MSWISQFMPSGPRRRRIEEMIVRIQSNQEETTQLLGETKNNLQAVQSGTRVLNTMSGMLRLVSEGTSRVPK